MVLRYYSNSTASSCCAPTMLSFFLRTSCTAATTGVRLQAFLAKRLLRCGTRGGALVLLRRGYEPRATLVTGFLALARKEDGLNGIQPAIIPSGEAPLVVVMCWS
jgi:hypothetical protein